MFLALGPTHLRVLADPVVGPTHLRVLGDPVAEHIQHTVGGSSADHKLLVAISLVRGKPWQC